MVCVFLELQEVILEGIYTFILHYESHRYSLTEEPDLLLWQMQNLHGKNLSYFEERAQIVFWLYIVMIS